MIYLVSTQKSLFNTNKYQRISLKEGLSLLEDLAYVQCDTETEGLDCHSKALLTIQLGSKDIQIVIDWTTLSSSDKLLVKGFMESSNRKFILHNAQFDLTFLYKQNIWPKQIIDTMLLEQLLCLGYPKVIKGIVAEEVNLNIPYYEVDESGNYNLSFALNHVAKRRLGIDIDKSVRGKINQVGLTTEVVIYAGTDVIYLEDIFKSQVEDLKKENLLKAAAFECEFVRSLAYIKYCGVHLDADKWKAKMTKDQASLKEATEKLNNWVVDWEHSHTTVKNGVRFVITRVDTATEVYPKVIQRLQKLGFARMPSLDTNKEAYIIKYDKVFTEVNTQGDLFSGFDTKPKCLINWASQAQVIPLFELLGIGVTTFDKATKKEKKSIESKQLKPQKEFFSILPIFLKYQEAAKVVSTYGQNWLDAINPITGRIHAEFHQFGTDTARLSSGGGPYKVNAQNLPHDAETRACFTAEKGNKWVSIDYDSQESRLIASVSKDEAMIKEFAEGTGDIHSLVAYMSYPTEIPRDTSISEIKQKYHNLRQEAKGIEFAINYGGDSHTIANNKGINIKQAEKIYNDFMAGFPGVAKYQEYCRKAVMRDGYILMNPILGHRAHIYDSEWLLRFQERMKDPGFWAEYNEAKEYDPCSDIIKDYKRYRKRKSDLEKQSINFRIQNRGAMCFKYSAILYFNWIVENNYQNIVKMCVPCHDEHNNEVPEGIAQQEADKIKECMIKGAAPFCTNVFLGASAEINDYWIH